MKHAKAMQQLKRVVAEARTKMLLVQMQAHRLADSTGVKCRYGISWKPLQGGEQECLVFKLQQGKHIAVRIIQVSEVVEMPRMSMLVGRLNAWVAEEFAVAKR